MRRIEIVRACRRIWRATMSEQGTVMLLVMIIAELAMFSYLMLIMDGMWLS